MRKRILYSILIIIVVVPLFYSAHDASTTDVTEDPVQSIKEQDNAGLLTERLNDYSSRTVYTVHEDSINDGNMPRNNVNLYKSH